MWYAKPGAQASFQSWSHAILAAFWIIAPLLSGVSAQGPPVITQLASLSSSGEQGNAGSVDFPAISGDGRFVAFASFASNLVPDDTNDVTDIFVHDRLSGVTERVSVSSTGEQALNVPNPSNSDSQRPAISADGRFVAFLSDATNLVQDDTNGGGPNQRPDVFVHDRLTRITERVSVSSNEEQTEVGCTVDVPAISDDGRFVAFASCATNLVLGDTNRSPDIFLRDRLLGTTERVSVSSTGEQALNLADPNRSRSVSPAISADGRFVVFVSWASNLVPGDTNENADVFIRDRLLGTTERASVSTTGQQPHSISLFSSVSADGRFVAFESSSGNLVTGDTNFADDIFVRDRQLGVTERVSVTSSGGETEPFAFSRMPSISADGRYVTFMSSASNLVDRDLPFTNDVFVRDRLLSSTERVSVSFVGLPANSACFFPAISPDGRYVAFLSIATNLVLRDTNDEADVFVHDRSACFTNSAKETPAAGRAACPPLRQP